MCVDFLNNSMRGTTHLEGVLDTYYTARKAAGTPDPFNITFEEYVERLIHMMRPLDKVVVVAVEVRISTLFLAMKVMKKKTLTTKKTLEPP